MATRRTMGRPAGHLPGMAELRRAVTSHLPVSLALVLLAGLCPLPGSAAPPSRSLPQIIDFGPGVYEAGSIPAAAADIDPSLFWVRGMVRDVLWRGEPDALRTDGVRGEVATLAIAVEPAEGLYRLRLVLGDRDARMGPLAIELNGRMVADSVVAAPGQYLEISCAGEPASGKLELRLSAGCAGFVLCGLAIEGPQGARLVTLLPVPPAVEAIPHPDALTQVDEHGLAILLGRLCKHLLDQSPETGGFSPDGAWYQNAYAARALLSAGVLLGEPRYSKAAVACLDSFVRTQRADGNWASSYFGSPECDSLSAGALSANLADIGTMSTSLALAAHRVDPERTREYLSAARVYADRMSLPNQYPDGSFPNGLWDGRKHVHSYTVATATQVSSLSALYEATGDSIYRDSALRGALWLARSILADGRLAFRPHDRDTIVVRQAASFGDAFYVGEALLAAHRVAGADSVAIEIRSALNRWLLGEHGVRSTASHGYWWPSTDPWNDSKIPGMIYILACHPRRRPGDEIDLWLGRTLAWLQDPGRCRLVGVIASPGDPLGEFAAPATGFAALGVAAALESSRDRGTSKGGETLLLRK